MRYVKTDEGAVLALNGETRPWSSSQRAHRYMGGQGGMIWDGIVLDEGLEEAVEISEAEAWNLAPMLMKALSEVKGSIR